MRKIALIYILLSVLVTGSLKAQNFVTTEIQKRNVIIEEYTGKHCSWCPEGQMTANAIAKNNPGKVFLMNIHAGPFSPTTFPNLNTDDGTIMVEDYGVTAYPAGFVNRTSAYEIAREQWSSYTLQQLQQEAECNIDGQVIINPATREAAITVEIYYTANSNASFNYLTIAMLQDSIMGDQDGGFANPEQYINGEYCHLHIMRDIITPTWGEEISPTTAGTLITKTYNYTIPEIVGDPNGVEVVLNNISFVAYVTESDDGIQTCPVLNVNELITVIDNNDEIKPLVHKVYPKSTISCSDSKTLVTNIVNAGKQEITSLLIKVSNENDADEFLWEGNVPSFHEALIESEMDFPVGENDVKVEILEVNGEEYNMTKTSELISEEWTEVDMSAEEEVFNIEIMQDKYGNQIRWFVLTSDYEVLASGGPYQMLSEPGTELRQETVSVKDGYCVKFVITDAAGNGICCSNGDGYYRILNSKGDVIIDGSGEFGAEAYHLLSMKYDGNDEDDDEGVEEENAFVPAKIYPNPTQNELYIECEGMKEISLMTVNGQIVNENIVDDNSFVVDMQKYAPGVYFLRIKTEESNFVMKVVRTK